jgi:hypothetical protein
MLRLCVVSLDSLDGSRTSPIRRGPGGGYARPGKCEMRIRDVDICQFLYFEKNVIGSKHLCLISCTQKMERARHPRPPAYLGHRNIQHTVRYTELAPTRFKNFWRE